MKNLRWLGQTESVDGKAWEAYLIALRDALTSSWAEFVAAYQSLRSVRQSLGLPFIVPNAPAEGAPPGMSSASAWAPDLDQQAVDIMAMVTLIKSAIDDTLRPASDPQKRNLAWNATLKQFGITARADDLLRLELQDNGLPVLIDAKTGAETQVQGTIGAVPVLLIGAGVVVAVVQTVGVVLIVKATCEAAKTIVENKTMQTMVEKQAELVQSGKATPEQAANMSKAVYSGAAELSKAKAQEAAAGSQTTSDITNTIKLVALVGLGIAVLFTVIRLVPPFERRPRAPTGGRQLALAP